MRGGGGSGQKLCHGNGWRFYVRVCLYCAFCVFFNLLLVNRLI